MSDLLQRIQRLENPYPTMAETWPPSPREPGPDSFAGQLAAAQAAKRARLEREAEIERVRLEREAAAKEAERRSHWEAHRKQREGAQKQLVRLEADLDSTNKRRDSLVQQIREQRLIAQRFEQ